MNPDKEEEHLARLGQSGPRFMPEDFQPQDCLYHGYSLNDIDTEDKKKRPRIETIRMPDFSCNWSRFSEPKDVRYRRGGNLTDGCYSFNVETVRLESLATTVHDPIFSNIDSAKACFTGVGDEALIANIDAEHPNYSHVEIRMLLEGEAWTIEPTRNRKPTGGKGKNKARRAAFRQNVLNHMTIEIQPES